MIRKSEAPSPQCYGLHLLTTKCAVPYGRKPSPVSYKNMVMPHPVIMSSTPQMSAVKKDSFATLLQWVSPLRR